MDDLGLPAVGMMSAYLHSTGVLPIMCCCCHGGHCTLATVVLGKVS